MLGKNSHKFSLLLLVFLLGCSNNSNEPINPNPFFTDIKQDQSNRVSYSKEYAVRSFYHEPRAGGDEPAVNKVLYLKNIRSINLHNVKVSKIDNFDVYFYVFRWGSVGGSIYESIDCKVTAYPTRINIEIPDDFIFEDHKYDFNGEGQITSLKRKYYIKFTYFDDGFLNYHFSIEENADEGIYKTSFEEDAVGTRPVYITK